MNTSSSPGDLIGIVDSILKQPAGQTVLNVLHYSQIEKLASLSLLFHQLDENEEATKLYQAILAEVAFTEGVPKFGMFHTAFEQLSARFIGCRLHRGCPDAIAPELNDGAVEQSLKLVFFSNWRNFCRERREPSTAFLPGLVGNMKRRCQIERRKHTVILMLDKRCEHPSRTEMTSISDIQNHPQEGKSCNDNPTPSTSALDVAKDIRFPHLINRDEVETEFVDGLKHVLPSEWFTAAATILHWSLAQLNRTDISIVRFQSMRTCVSPFDLKELELHDIIAAQRRISLIRLFITWWGLRTGRTSQEPLLPLLDRLMLEAMELLSHSAALSASDVFAIMATLLHPEKEPHGGIQGLLSRYKFGWNAALQPQHDISMEAVDIGHGLAHQCLVSWKWISFSKEAMAIYNPALRNNVSQEIRRLIMRDCELRKGVSLKLRRLSEFQFGELQADVFDELSRRQRVVQDGIDMPYLLPDVNFHVRRNEARRKLSRLKDMRYRDLLADVVHEKTRRAGLDDGK